MKTIEQAIAMDLLKKYSRTKSISEYSPLLNQIADRCRAWYPAETGKCYDVLPEHIRAVAIRLGIRVSLVGQVAISAQQFNDGASSKAAYRPGLVCIHGFSPYTYVHGETTRQPKIRPICPKCLGGIQKPSESQIAEATRCLQSAGDTTQVTPGALILAAQRLGYEVRVGKEIVIGKKRSAGDSP